MIELRKAEERGHASHDWLESHHSFSFAEYHDPEHMAFGPLRVINEDIVQPGTGFGMHGHADMEIITYVLEGELQHRDSMGNGSVIRPGNVQRMSAGSGVRHSETNPSQENPVHLLQIWIKPDVRGIAPEYEEKYFDAAEKRGLLRLIASPDGSDGSVRIHQDARVYAGLFDGEEKTRLEVGRARRVYLHVARGTLFANGIALQPGDALKLENEATLTLAKGEQAEVLVFELP
jgi:quercetin 2,3-dioxygenase